MYSAKKYYIGFIQIFFAFNISVCVSKVDAAPMYCSAPEGHYGNTYYISTIFDDHDEYSVGIQNDFDSHVSASYLGKNSFIRTPICTRFPDIREANTSRNDWITRLKRDNRNVVVVNWSY